MTTTTFHNAYGDFSLRRRPLTPQLPLQAWDACDEYLLAEAHTCVKNGISHVQVHNLQVLVINDQFGALATAFSQAYVCSWGDSYTAHRATLDNFADNQLDNSKLVLLPSTQAPTQMAALQPPQKFDLVLWRIPKTVALLQQQMHILAICVNTTTVIFAGGMQKHLPAATRDILQKLGEVDTLLAQKKARLFSVKPLSDQLRQNYRDATPTVDAHLYPPLLIDEYGLQLHAGPNVFARDTFDIGARFFIEQFGKLPRVERIADLGCGNGILGILAQRKIPSAQIEFFDESYQAIAAAENNYGTHKLDASQVDAKFHVDDIFANYTGEPFDLILCNPPFHQGHVVGDHIARQMFIQSRQQLRCNGELWIVGNRHLDYHLKLKKVFGNCRQIAANAKFVVLAARVA